MRTIKKVASHIFIDGFGGMTQGLFATLIIIWQNIFPRTVGNLYIHYTLIKRTMFLKGMITRQKNGQKVCWIRPFFQNGYIRKILI